MAPPSEVWQYFIKMNKKVQCSKCQVELNFCNSTSSMQKHLKTAHRIELCSVSSSKKRKIASSPANAGEPIASTSREVSS